MSDQKVPKTPDYSPMINAYNAIAAHSDQMGSDAMAWAKDQVANNKDLTSQINGNLLDTSKSFAQAAKDTLAKGQQTRDDATGYLKGQRDRYRDPNYVANDMGASEAQVGQAFDAARNSSLRELEGYGLNPGDTRFAGLDATIRTQRAAAQAAAGTTAARTDEGKADQANAQLLQQGNIDTGQSTNLSATGSGAGQGAVQNNLAGTASGANVLGTDLAWTGAKSGALGGAVGAQNTGFNNEAKSDEISNSSSSGIGSLLGMGASMLGKGGAFASGGALSGAGAALMAFEEGGAIPDTPGGEVPMEASPSNGAATDDVAASAPGVPNIRLNGGEFVIPKDVASYQGEKFFQGLIMKSRKAMGQGTEAERPVGPAVGGGPDQPVRRAPAMAGAI